MINRVCVRRGIPWVFAAAGESYGLMMNILPGETPCLACIFEDADREALGQACGKAMLPAITHVMASLQVSQVIKILVGDDDYSKDLIYVDVWDLLLEKISVTGPQRGCRVCGGLRGEGLAISGNWSRRISPQPPAPVPW
jgi:adenylyltransferase/sulfurtransferase